jgi:peptidoglycan/LPS O-acetylase OafA/YrhL
VCLGILTYVLALTPDKMAYRLLTFGPVAYLGRISYMMYLLHSTLIMFFVHYWNSYSHLLSRSAALASTIILSAAFWHLIEKRTAFVAKKVVLATSVTAHLSSRH